MALTREAPDTTTTTEEQPMGLITHLHPSDEEPEKGTRVETMCGKIRKAGHEGLLPWFCGKCVNVAIDENTLLVRAYNRNQETSHDMARRLDAIAALTRHDIEFTAEWDGEAVFER